MTYSIRGDVHTHTLYSRHAYSTIQENVEAASQAGLELLGSADHFSAMLFPACDPDTAVRNYQFFFNQEIWPREWKGVTLLRACEADILTLEGGLYGEDVPAPYNITGSKFVRDRNLYERVTYALDYVVASVHAREFAEGATLAQTTAMYVGALEHKKVFILGHTGRSSVPYDIDEVLTVAKEKHKLIEINEHSFDNDPEGVTHAACRKIAERCAELGVGISVDTDAHIAPLIGRSPRAQSMLKEIHFPEELIVNRGCEPFLRELATAGVCDLTGLLDGEAA